MDTCKELQGKLNEQTSDVYEAVIKLKKAALVLSDWTNEYGFWEKPDPAAAVRWGASKSPKRARNEEQSAKWFCEYERIFSLVDIALDYVHASKELLEKIICDDVKSA